MTNLTMKELRDLYAEEYSVTKVEAKQQLEGIFEFFEDVLVDKQVGFKFGNIGTFEIVTNPEKIYRNPKTGEELPPTPAHLGLKYKPNKGAVSVRERLKQI